MSYRRVVARVVTGSLVTQSGMTLTCQGSCKAPALSLSDTCINFGDVAQGDLRSKRITLTNHSAVRTAFQFSQHDNTGSIRVSPTCGHVGPRTTHVITVTFAPQAAQNFFKRMFCIGEHAVTPLWLDVAGTCFADGKRPAQLLPVCVVSIQVLLMSYRISYAESCHSYSDTSNHI